LISSGPTLYQQHGPEASFLMVLNQNVQTTSLPTTDPWESGSDNPESLSERPFEAIGDIRQ
jgi:hypothetical protein